MAESFNESPWLYQLKAAVEFSELEQAEAYKRLERYGRWLEGMWWQPSNWQAQTAVKRIQREGFEVVEIKAADIE